MARYIKNENINNNEFIMNEEEFKKFNDYMLKTKPINYFSSSEKSNSKRLLKEMFISQNLQKKNKNNKIKLRRV